MGKKSDERLEEINQRGTPTEKISNELISEDNSEYSYYIYFTAKGETKKGDTKYSFLDGGCVISTTRKPADISDFRILSDYIKNQINFEGNSKFENVIIANLIELDTNQDKEAEGDT